MTNYSLPITFLDASPHINGRRSRKAVNKARRKLRRALRAKTPDAMAIAIGMASVALGKARFQSNLKAL